MTTGRAVCTFTDKRQDTVKQFCTKHQDICRRWNRSWS